MVQSLITLDEYRVRMPAHLATPRKREGAKQEKLLNRFVRVVAFVERVGNAFGTLAFTWATVVLLGGYPTVLKPDFPSDFWFATIIIFLEAARMFSRNNRHDYQLFFNTKGSLRRLGWNGLIVIACLSNIFNYIIGIVETEMQIPLVFRVLITLLVVFTPVLGMFERALKLLPKSLHNAISIFSPSVAILLMVPSIVVFTIKNMTAKWIMFLLLFLPVLLLTITRLGFPIISRQLDSAMGTRKEFWHRLVLRLCMLATLVMLVFMPDNPTYGAFVFIYELYALVILSFGNLQIPAAVARVVLALMRLIPQDYCHRHDADNPSKTNNSPAPGDDDSNLVPSLNIFYGMVLGQGLLYVVACILEIFSFIPRRFLARRTGLRSRWGKKCINLYYEYAVEKSMEGDVLAPKNVSLDSFAMYCMDSDKPKLQLRGIRIMHSLLLREEIREQLHSKVTNSTKTIARLIEMLDWSSPEDTATRLFAAKVTSELAKSLRVVAIPGTVQIVSALLDSGNRQQRANPLLNTDAEHEIIPEEPIQNNDDNHAERLDACQDTGNREQSQVDTAKQHKSRVIGCWQRVFGFWSDPRGEPKPLTEKDVLPALGMSILDGLVGCDQDNCVEISRASGIVPKIIRFTSYGRRSDTEYTDTQRNVLMESSLKLLHSLTSIHGEIGVTLRKKVFNNPFLLRNLADVLGDRMCSQDLKKLVVGILRNLAIDGEARQGIGRNQVIMSRLMHAFLPPDGSSGSESSDGLLRKVAGQALAMLAMDSVSNCLAMIREPKYEFIKELTGLIHVERYRCVAASLLQSMCRHARPELKDPDLKELSYGLREVLERIMMDAESAELEIFIGLSSQICQVIPGDFARELEGGHIKDGFVKRLVDALNAYTEPSADCPGIRRVILEQAISLMEYDTRYANCFKDRGIMEALSVVEETASDVENYSLFLGDAGLIQAGEPLPVLEARAKQLLAVHSQPSSGIRNY